MHETIPPETSGKRKKERKNRSRYPRAVSLILSTLLRIAAVDSGYLIFERAYSEREGGGGGEGRESETTWNPRDQGSESIRMRRAVQRAAAE